VASARSISNVLVYSTPKASQTLGMGTFRWTFWVGDL
jgi:hypothetical protein